MMVGVVRVAEEEGGFAAGAVETGVNPLRAVEVTGVSPVGMPMRSKPPPGTSPLEGVFMDMPPPAELPKSRPRLSGRWMSMWRPSAMVGRESTAAVTTWVRVGSSCLRWREAESGAGRGGGGEAAAGLGEGVAVVLLGGADGLAAVGDAVVVAEEVLQLLLLRHERGDVLVLLVDLGVQLGDLVLQLVHLVDAALSAAGCGLLVAEPTDAAFLGVLVAEVGEVFFLLLGTTTAGLPLAHAGVGGVDGVGTAGGVRAGHDGEAVGLLGLERTQNLTEAGLGEMRLDQINSSPGQRP